MSQMLPKPSITFKVDKVRSRRKLYPQQPMQDIVKLNLGQHVEVYSKQHESLIPTQGHGLIVALHNAYADHYPLTLSPDHIWLLLCQGFARHMTLHGQVLQDDIIEFEGKKTLRLLRPDFRRGRADNQWEAVFSNFSQQIRQHVGDDMHRLLTPTFSTTSPLEKAAYEITMLESVQPIFNETPTWCGIPSITLEGTPDDWRKMLKRVRYFRTYGLRWWTDKLEPILQHFVDASEGHADSKFWKNIYKLEGGSGGPFITGWILKLFPYIGDATNPVRNPYIEREPELNKRMEGLTMRSLPSGLSSASVRCDDGVNQWDVAFVTGFFGVSQAEDSAALRPEIAWAIRDETAIKETRKQIRLAERDCKEVHAPTMIRVADKHLRVQFKNGKRYISDMPLWERDGKLAEMTKKRKIKPDTWAEVEYNHFLYRYDPERIPDELAMTVIQTHEAKMSKQELLPRKP